MKCSMSTFALFGFGEKGWGACCCSATGVTLAVTAAALLIGAVIGSLVAWAKLSAQPAGADRGDLYTTVFRGVPELLVIFLFYFGGSSVVSGIGHLFGYEGFIGVPTFLAGALAVGVISGAYQAEVFRSAFRAVSRARSRPQRRSACRSCCVSAGSSLPRCCASPFPGLGNVWQLSLKDSALVSVTGLAELMRTAQRAAGSTRDYFEFYIAAAVLYLVLTAVSNRVVDRAEARVSRIVPPPARLSGWSTSPSSRTCWPASRGPADDARDLRPRASRSERALAMGLTWMRVSRNRVLDRVARAYVFVFRGSPLLVQLFLIYYGLGQFPEVRHSFAWPVLREPFACAVISLGLCTAAYQTEIFRGALAAVSEREVEAARACGMSGFLLFRRIILPDRDPARAAAVFDRDDPDGEVDLARLNHHGYRR